MISLANEVVYFQEEGYFKANSLNEIAQLLGDNQKMRVKRCSMEDIPRKLNTFPKDNNQNQRIYSERVKDLDYISGWLLSYICLEITNNLLFFLEEFT